MTDYRALLLNSVASDPTRTLTLRNKWVADWNRRIKALKSVVLKAIVEQDVFGLKEQEHFLQVQEDLPVPEPRKFAYRYSQQKVEAFMAWLKEMESRSLLEIIQRPGTLRPEGEPWSNLYVRSAYQRGLEYARTNIASRSAEIAAGMGLKVPLPPSFKSTGAAISALLHQPFHADRLALAYTRVFDELKGVTAAMDQQISRELAKGIMEGLNPRDIGERIGDRIEAIGATRGRLIARTEVINVHAQAALNEYYSAEKTTGEVVLVQWKATHDSRVREKHLDRDMGVYTKEEAYALIGEPNCRCALLPYIPAVQGMPAKATAAARKVCKSAIEDLDEREKKLLEKKAELKKLTWNPPEKFSEDWCLAKFKEFGFHSIAKHRVNKEVFQKAVNGCGEDLVGLFNRYPGLRVVLENLDRQVSRYVTRSLDFYPGDTLPAVLVSNASGLYSVGSISLSTRYKDFHKGPGPYEVGRGDAGDPYNGISILRHEFGHFLHDFISKEMKQEWESIFSSLGGIVTKDRRRQTANNPIRTLISPYAATNHSEGFAESFAIYVNEEYGAGNRKRLPDQVEKFFKKVLDR